MELMPKSIEVTLPRLYGTESVSLADKIVRLKLFCPWSPWTWYVVEYDPTERLCWGLVQGFEVEWGYFSLDDLEGIRGPGGLRIERDLQFEPMTVRAVVEGEHIVGAF